MTDDAAARARIEAALRAVPLTTRCGLKGDTEGSGRHTSDCYWPDFPAMAAAVATFTASEVAWRHQRILDLTQSNNLWAERAEKAETALGAAQEALRKIEQLTDDPKETMRGNPGLWQVIIEVHQTADDALVRAALSASPTRGESA